MTGKPTIGIITGDPAGIGPEITLKALAAPGVRDACLPVVIGDCGLLARLGRQMGLSFLRDGVEAEADGVRVIDSEAGEVSEPVVTGSVSAAAGRAMLRGIRRAFALAIRGQLQAVVMAPITKESVALADGAYHSEFDVFDDLAGVVGCRAVVTWNQIARITVTGHMPFREIADHLTAEEIAAAGRELLSVMADLGLESPRIAVAALNPHAGEGGLFGDEEETLIAPAIRALRDDGVDVLGPVPADTVFWRSRQGEFQGIVYLYHDQGNIAMKSAAFGEGVLVYTRLPFPVTSPGHGSALDIAGKGIADPGNLVESIRLAAQLATTRHREARPTA